MLYRVGFWYTEGGYVDVEANSKEGAEQKLMTLLGDYGLDVLNGASEYGRDSKHNHKSNQHGLSCYRVTHREWQQV